MFSGIVQAIGSIRESAMRDGDIRLTIDGGGLELGDVRRGDSIAVNGVCLTVIELGADCFVADVSLETLNKTSLGRLAAQSPVNLEKALTLETALGGHLVSGHVDGLATLLEMEPEARSIVYRFEVDPALQHYVAVKGSVTLDGTSLTVNRVEENRFDVNIVPHTQQQTVFQYYSPGVKVNLEVDLVARYVERLLDGRANRGQAARERRLVETLIKSGFIEDEQSS